MWLSTLAIAGGGAAGALSRIGLTGWLGDDAIAFRTLSVTLAINTLGALLLGILRTGAPRSIAPELLPGITVGFLGGFTTWSAVIIDGVALADITPVFAVGYLLVTVVAGVGGAWAGLVLGERMSSQTR